MKPYAEWRFLWLKAWHVILLSHSLNNTTTIAPVRR